MTPRKKSDVILGMSDCVAFLNTFRTSRVGILIDNAGGRRAALIAPAQNMDADRMNNLLSWSGGLPFVAISPERADAFHLATMARPRVHAGGDTHSLALPQYISVEAREGVSTGISAADRATTVAVLGDSEPQTRRLVQPGHIFPVETRPGGVLVKAALAEGAIDLIKLSGFTDAALFMDLLNDQGDFVDDLGARQLSLKYGIPLISITEIIEYRLSQERLVTRIVEAKLPTTVAGELRSIIYRSKIHDAEHIALVKGTVDHGRPVLVRVQAENTVADIFGGLSRHAIQSSLKTIGERGEGVVIYLRRAFIDDKNRPVQLLGAPLNAEHQSPVLMREYGVGAQILRDLGVTKIELLTTAARPIHGLTGFGLEIISNIVLPDEREA